MTNKKTDYLTCEVLSLIENANRAGVHYFLPPITGTHYPNCLMVWNHRDPEGQRIVDAMRARHDDVAAFLRAHRPAPLTIPPEEEAYRREVLGEPDVLMGDLTVAHAKALVIGWVFDTAATIFAERAWEHGWAEDDAKRATTVPAKPRRAARRAAASERVVFE